MKDRFSEDGERKDRGYRRNRPESQLSGLVPLHDDETIADSQLDEAFREFRQSIEEIYRNSGVTCPQTEYHHLEAEQDRALRVSSFRESNLFRMAALYLYWEKNLQGFPEAKIADDLKKQGFEGIRGRVGFSVDDFFSWMVEGTVLDQRTAEKIAHCYNDDAPYTPPEPEKPEGMEGFFFRYFVEPLSCLPIIGKRVKPFFMPQRYLPVEYDPVTESDRRAAVARFQLCTKIGWQWFREELEEMKREKNYK